MKRGQLDEAERLFRDAIRSQNPAAAPMAMSNLGELCVKKGETSEAERLFREAMGSQQLAAAAQATLHLARLQQSRGNGGEAMRLYRVACESGIAEIVELATAALDSLTWGGAPADQAPHGLEP
jgi:Tfp pilus assembly protein PilF